MERSIHHQLKRFYADNDENTEVKIGSFRIDAIRNEELIEIQCASLSALRDKTRKLVECHQLRIVKPIIARKRLTKVAKVGGRPLSSRMSPKTGQAMDIFEELIYFTRVFPHPNLVLEVPLVQVEEYRAPPAAKRKRRQRWKKKFQVADVKLLSIDQTVELRTTGDLIKLLKWRRRPKHFNTADLAKAIQRPRWFAQQVAYVLRNVGAIKQVDRDKNGIVYAVERSRKTAKKAA